MSATDQVRSLTVAGKARADDPGKPPCPSALPSRRTFGRRKDTQINAKFATRMLSILLISVTIMIPTALPASGSSTDIEVQNSAIIVKAFDDWANGTGGPYELLSESVSWTITGHSLASRTYSGREDFMRNVIRPFNARMKSPLKPAIRSLHADGERVIVFFDADGVATDGKDYVNTYAWFLDLHKGQIVRAYAFFDSVAFNDLWARVQTTADAS